MCVVKREKREIECEKVRARERERDERRRSEQIGKQSQSAARRGKDQNILAAILSNAKRYPRPRCSCQIAEISVGIVSQAVGKSSVEADASFQLPRQSHDDCAYTAGEQLTRSR